MKGSILQKIVEAKRIRVEETKKAFGNPRTVRKKRAHSFLYALSDRSRPHVIAEFKRASPSKGVINDLLDPATAARHYSEGGAAAISVLTEEDFFRGSLDDLRGVRAAVDVPILRKDFIIDEFQIREAAAAGADAVLLIVAAVSIDELRRFQSVADDLGLDALLEVHDDAEMQIAVDIGSKLIGVNNRNLHNFEVSLETSRRVVALAPSDAVLVTESGLTSREEIYELFELGYSGFLIGEALMRSGAQKTALEALTGGTRAVK